jgi:exosortase A-associated hydrolase 2
MLRQAAEHRPDCHPFFFETSGRRLYAIHHDPGARGHVLVVLPFNEEMNRCRSMITLQARALAQRGLGTLVLDHFGTGDSGGEHGDARWELWLEDLRAAVGRLDAQPGGCRAILGIRLGAILAADLHRALGRPDLALAFWQPVVNGQVYLTQFLRMKIAAQLDLPNAPKETTASMRERFARGEPVEISGYEIHPALAKAIDSASLARSAPPPSTPVLWLENAPSADSGIPPASQAVIDAWRTAGVGVEPRLFPGPAFWALYERVLAPAAIEETGRWLGDRVAAR